MKGGMGGSKDEGARRWRLALGRRNWNGRDAQQGSAGVAETLEGIYRYRNLRKLILGTVSGVSYLKDVAAQSFR
jgi:hypothetical protein